MQDGVTYSCKMNKSTADARGRKEDTMSYLLGVDIGTSGTKTVLFDIQGKTIASDTQEYPLYQPKNGWA